MKFNFSSLVGFAGISLLAFSCSAPRYASAQQPDEGGYYTPAPQPPAAAPQDDYAYDGQSVEDQQDVDFNAFYDALAPYGTWENDNEYGQVWVNNDPGFVPYYSNGNWAYTNDGWAWVSNYNWGWAPFHYGRWAYRGHWMWVPGYDWAPAWVSWRTGGDYYGWAPLGPGISIGVNIGYGGYMAPERWIFCQRGYIASPHFSNYCVDRSRNITIINNTTVINRVNVYRGSRFVAGPERRDVERYSGNRINPMRIRSASRPGAATINRGDLQVYRPNIRQNGFNRQQAQPQRNFPQAGNGNPRYQQPGSRQQQFPQARPPQQAPVQTSPNTMPNRPSRPVRSRDRQQGAFNNDRPAEHSDAAINNQPVMQQRQPVFNRPQRQVMPQSQQPQYGTPAQPRMPERRPEYRQQYPSAPAQVQPQVNRQPQQRSFDRQPQFNRPQPGSAQPQQRSFDRQPQFNRPQPGNAQPRVNNNRERSVRRV